MQANPTDAQDNGKILSVQQRLHDGERARVPLTGPGGEPCVVPGR